MNLSMISKRFFKKTFSDKEVSEIMRELSFLTSSDIQLSEGLDSISERFGSSKQIFLSSLSKDIKSGSSLSEVLNKQNILDESFLSLISIGESSGSLSESLALISHEIDKKIDVKNKLILSLMYPFVVMLSTFGMITFIMTYIFPKIIPLLKSMNTDLPFLTKVLITTNHFFISAWIYIIIGLFIFSILIFLFIRNKNNRLYIDRLQLKIPVFGRVIRLYNLSFFFGGLHILIKSGLSPDKSLLQASKSLPNFYIKNKIGALSSQIYSGKRISQAFSGCPEVFFKSIIGIISSGEMSGSLTEAFEYLSLSFRNEFDSFTKKVSSLLEPLLLLLAGLCVGVIALGVIMPIYKIAGNVIK